jgi:hypothetical protein
MMMHHVLMNSVIVDESDGTAQDGSVTMTNSVMSAIDAQCARVILPNLNIFLP